MLSKETIAQVLKISPDKIDKFGINQKCVNVWLKDSPEILSVSFEKLGMKQEELISPPTSISSSTASVVSVVVVMFVFMSLSLVIKNYKPADEPFDITAEAKRCILSNSGDGKYVTQEDIDRIQVNCGYLLREIENQKLLKRK
ncbi:hypothetical protein [Leptolyngbya sp. FACHB-1624]|uniref:hypothetical protein n=1 Tax=Leptolyngbya sp. FACHB-1624 TaxID=2692802 RepID=UPI0039EB9BC4